MDNLDLIEEKVRKLFALSTSDNPHEAALALEKAQELLLKYNLDESRIRIAGEETYDTSIGQSDYNWGAGKQEYPWQRVLLGVLARGNMCRAIGNKQERLVHLFGTKHNVTMVKEMHAWVIEQLEPMAQEQWLLHKAGVQKLRSMGMDSWELSQYTPLKFKTSFYTGAIDTIKTRLNAGQEKFTSDPSSMALIVVNDKALADIVHKIFPRLGQMRMSQGYGGYQAGQAAGAGVSFTRAKQVGSGYYLGSGS